ncbi:F-box/kelch-repeat protein At3g23880-like [Lycium barbarum]|uniref:F-box/kelch-repeat protein At3g23880-like n=1 Tax=Lycium barbarum TaxID=112863 RepID=UPI00293E0431|nr:F-box/kelch-repeat protein At3g23880-like [Lycium barbarum]
MYEEPLHIPTDLAFVGEDPFCIGYQILGSCDGLFCTACDFEDLFLWNPSTTELKNLPPLGINLHLKEEGNDFSYGFGYIECQSDYRVVEIVENKCNNCYKNDVSVYSLRTNSWKMIQECPNVNFLDQADKFVNGKLHWVVADPDRYRVSGRNSTCKIKTDVWVTKEYESWTKVASIPLKIYDAWPIFISQNDEILVHDGSSLVWYNTRDNTFVRPVNQIHCISANNFSGCYGAVTHVFENQSSPGAGCFLNLIVGIPDVDNVMQLLEFVDSSFYVRHPVDSDGKTNDLIK